MNNANLLINTTKTLSLCVYTSAQYKFCRNSESNSMKWESKHEMSIITVKLTDNLTFHPHNLQTKVGTLVKRY